MFARKPEKGERRTENGNPVAERWLVAPIESGEPNQAEARVGANLVFAQLSGKGKDVYHKN